MEINGRSDKEAENYVGEELQDLQPFDKIDKVSDAKRRVRYRCFETPLCDREI